MKPARRPWLLFAFFLLLLWTPGHAQTAKPKLVVAIVADQFRYDYLVRFRSDYHAGLARLLEHGAVFTDARYIHYPTVTAIGHSTFMSGATPSVSGIIGNEWYDRDSKQAVTSVSDSSTALLGGAPGAKGSSPRRLLVSTLGDELKMSARPARVISISMKDRSAILPGGHMADAAYWFDPDSNHFVSSTYYMNALPAWVAQVNADGPLRKYTGQVWRPFDAKPGDQPFCSMTAGNDLRFCGPIENTWFGNELLEEFAEKAIINEQLGTHAGTDLLALSFSSNDYVGHELGPDSKEVRDISIRTDQLLGKLLDFIDARIGGGNTLVVFTADHGVSPTPKANHDRRMPGGYLDAAAYSQKIAAALSAKFGSGDWFLYNSAGFLYLNYETVAKNNANPVEVRNLAAEAARKLPNIARVLTRDDLLRGSSSADFAGRALQLGFYGPRSGDLVLLPEPYYMFYQGPGTTHATPYGYDTHVPLIFYGTGIHPGIYRRPATVNDVAPTLADLLEVETPSGSSGRVLTEIVEEHGSKQ